MFVKSLAQNSVVACDSTGLSKAQQTALTTAWSLFKDNLSDHARNIFAKFYEENPEYLRLFYDLGNDAMHQHTEDVLQWLGTMVDDGLKDPEMFDRDLRQIAKFHHNLIRADVIKLNKIIKNYMLRQLEKHKSKTLEDALDAFLVQIELKFEDSTDVNNEEL